MLRWIRNILLVLLFLILKAYFLAPLLPMKTPERNAEIREICKRYARIRYQYEPNMQQWHDYAQCLNDHKY